MLTARGFSDLCCPCSWQHRIVVYFSILYSVSPPRGNQLGPLGYALRSTSPLWRKIALEHPSRPAPNISCPHNGRDWQRSFHRFLSPCLATVGSDRVHCLTYSHCSLVTVLKMRSHYTMLLRKDCTLLCLTCPELL